MAPPSARRSPSRGLEPALAPPASPTAINAPPEMATMMPAAVRREGVSPRQNQRIRATQIGLVVTMVALAAMEVYAREVIHKAKCAPRKIPASTVYRSAPSLRLVFRI